MEYFQKEYVRVLSFKFRPILVIRVFDFHKRILKKRYMHRKKG